MKNLSIMLILAALVTYQYSKTATATPTPNGQAEETSQPKCSFWEKAVSILSMVEKSWREWPSNSNGSLKKIESMNGLLAPQPENPEMPEKPTDLIQQLPKEDPIQN